MFLIGSYGTIGRSRSLRGNVDRNITISYLYIIRIDVVPYVGTWLEMAMLRHGLIIVFARRSLRGNVDRNLNLNDS